MKAKFIIYSGIIVSFFLIMSSINSSGYDWSGYDWNDSFWMTDDLYYSPYMDNPAFNMGEAIIGEEHIHATLIGNWAYSYYMYDGTLLSEGGYFDDSLMACELDAVDLSFDEGPSLNQESIDVSTISFVITGQHSIYETLEDEFYASEINKVILYVAFDLQTYPFPGGWLSFQHSTDYIGDLIPWSNQTWRDCNYNNAELESGGWYNSTASPFIEDIVFVRENVCFFWDVTYLYGWEPDSFNNTYAMFTCRVNATVNPRVCFLGFYIECGYEYRPMDSDSYWEEEDLPEVSLIENFSGLIWLLIVFFPVIAMGQYIPKIGYIVGMSIILIILGFTQAGFMPITMIGFCGLGILIYRS